jgi:hypothetical protein
MTLCLLVYGALEYHIRQTLQQRNKHFPTRSGPPPQCLARWVLQFFAGIHVLVRDNWRERVLNCNVYRHQLLNLPGKRYVLL